MENQTSSDFFKFGIFTGHFNSEGNVQKEKSVGMAFMRKGNDSYSMKLWTFPREKYYLVPAKEDPKKILIMTREAKKVQTNDRKYNWSVVGTGQVYDEKGFAQLEFDLIQQPIFMNIEPAPERSKQPSNLSVA
jgi:hypothetical protein